MEFQPEKESWQSYAERLDHYFTASKVIEDDQKVTALIIANDPSFYTLLKELSFPINPKTMTYNDVMGTLERHYVGVKNIFRERKLFYNAVLGPNESASEWYRRLKSLAIDCEFGVLLEEVLVDKFVCGFKGKILQAFYEQDRSLDLLKALKIAQLHETAIDDYNVSIAVAKDQGDESIEEGENGLWEDIDDDDESDGLWEDIDDDHDDDDDDDENGLWEDLDDQESEFEDNDYKHKQPSSIEDKHEIDNATRGTNAWSNAVSTVSAAATNMYATVHLLNGMFSSKSQHQRRTEQHNVAHNNYQRVARKKQHHPQQNQVKINQQQVPQQRNLQKHLPFKQQKLPQSQTNQKPIQKQNNQPNQQRVKSQQQKPPQPHTNQKPVQKQNNQPNQQQVKSQNQQYNHKPTSNTQKPSMPTHSQPRPQQPRNHQQHPRNNQQQPQNHQQPSQSVQKSMPHQQKPQPQKSQTVQNTTTIIKKTVIKTSTATVSNPKKGPTKCHKCGKVGHIANACNSK